MDYTYNRQLAGDIADVAERTREALKKEGFGVLTEIDIAATLKAKLNADFPPYHILGACNPPLAKLALEVEPRVGVMLPCNVIVREAGAGMVEVAAINPSAPMAAIGNPALNEIAKEVGGRLKRVVESL